MTLAAAAHAQRRIHVHIVARQVQADESLEHNAESGPCARQENEQARGCASIGDHVQHRAKLCALLKVAGCDPVEGIEEAGYAVEYRACAWVERHVVERG